MSKSDWSKAKGEYCTSFIRESEYRELVRDQLCMVVMAKSSCRKRDFWGVKEERNPSCIGL